jgi:hypothetical protein
MLASKQLTLLHVSLTGETARTSQPVPDEPGARRKDRRKLIFAIVSSACSWPLRPGLRSGWTTQLP